MNGKKLLDDLHVGHARLLRLGRLIGHGHAHVEERTHRHEQGETANMSAVKRNGEGQIEDAVEMLRGHPPTGRIGRACPMLAGEEIGTWRTGPAFAARPGSTAGQGVDAGLAVQRHGGLLLGHGIVFMFLVELLDLGTEHLHFRRGHEVFPGNGGEGEFDDQRDDQDE